jgi:hypothetical protein
MTDLPRKARRTCDKCSAGVAWVKTNRTSAGQPVELMIDFTADAGTGGEVPVQVVGDTLYGNPVRRAQADAMRAAGQTLHTQHKKTCVKRNANHRGRL